MKTALAIVAALAVAAPAAVARQDGSNTRTLELGKPEKDGTLKITFERKSKKPADKWDVAVELDVKKDWSAEKKAEEFLKKLDAEWNKLPRYRDKLRPRREGSKIVFPGGENLYIEKTVTVFDKSGEIDKSKINKDNKMDLVNGAPKKDGGVKPKPISFSGTYLDENGNEVPGSTLTFGVEGIYVSHLPLFAGESASSALVRLYADLSTHFGEYGYALSHTGTSLDIAFGAEIDDPSGSDWSIVWGCDDVAATGEIEWEVNHRSIVPAPGAMAALALAGLASARRRR